MTQTDVSPRALPRLVAFDLDDTLAPSKSAMPPAMATALRRLLVHGRYWTGLFPDWSWTPTCDGGP